MKLSFRKICLFWGMMDVFYIARFIWLNVEQGRIPLIDDFMSFSQLYSEYGGGVWIVLMFSLSMILNVSVVISAILLITCWRRVGYFIFIQTPFRLLLVIPSVSFVPWLLKQLHISSMLVFVTFLVISEVIKVISFILAKTTKTEGTANGE